MTHSAGKSSTSQNPTPENNNPCLQQNDDWQTPSSGTNHDEYQTYVVAATSLGWPVKPFHQWLNS